MNFLNVLLVEDNQGDVILTTEALKESQLAKNISIVRDGWEALKYLRKEGDYQENPLPDILLLDINLPKINGLEVLREIRSGRGLEQLPVVLFSTAALPEELTANTSKDKFSRYLTKPVHADDILKLTDSIREFLFSLNQLFRTDNI